MPSIHRRQFGVAALALAIAGLLSPTLSAAHDGPYSSGKVFTATNSPAGNELLVLGPDASGKLALLQRLPTQGLGSGAGLGSQGAVTLSDDGRHLFVVNAGSNTVSTFSLRGNGLTLDAVTDSGGLMPISVTERDGLVYVLNAGGAGNVAGFKLRHDGLQPVAGSVRGLSAAGGTGPAQVGLSADGDTLLVTEKATNKLVSWRVGSHGTLGSMTVTPSAGVTPFGFAFDRRDRAVVSEAVGGAALGSSASSYRFSERSPAQPQLVSSAVPTLQTAACWVVITPDGRHAYTGNAGSSSISRFGLARDGSLSLAEAAAGITGVGTGVTDLAISRSGRMLYALSPGATQIVAFDLGADGRLTPSSTATGLPARLVGLAAN